MPSKYGGATAHACHGAPLQDDSTDGAVQYNLQPCVPICGLVARLKKCGAIGEVN